MESGLVAGSLIDGKYKILRLVGIGGMGSVYEGENTRIHRRVAIKVLHAAVASERGLVERFEREAQAAARIGSHHVADVLDLGELPTGERFMVMEFLEGETLAERLAKVKTIGPRDVIPLATQLLDGLAVMHEAGIVHRDLKPGNVFLAKGAEGDFVKILDFGVAKFRAAHDLQWTTAGGNLLGTPGYMAPEQITQEAVDGRADLYSVGILLYRCVSKRFPYEAESASDLLLAIRDADPTPITTFAPDLDEAFAALVMKSIERDPERRFASAQAMKQALLAWLGSASGKPGTRAPRFTKKPPPSEGAAAAPDPAIVENTVRMPRPPPRPAAEPTPRLPGAVLAESRPSPRAEIAADPLANARVRAIVLGAAVGAVAAVIVYRALFR